MGGVHYIITKKYFKQKMKLTVEELHARALAHQTRSQLYKHDMSAYMSAKRQGLLDTLYPYLGVAPAPLTFEQLQIRAAQFTRRVDFKRGDDSAYKSAIRQGFIDALFPKKVKPPKPLKEPRPVKPQKPKRKLRRLSHGVVSEIASQYVSRTGFENADKSACNYARKHGLLVSLFPEKKYAAGTTDLFIERARLVHGDRYDYSQVSYTRHKVKVPILCGEHGEFWQRPSSHLAGRGCAKCWSFDNNAFYLKRALGCFFNGLPVYKVGVTSTRLGLSRLKRQGAKCDIEHEVVIPPAAVIGSATDIEVFALSLGYNPKFVGFDGCTEYRAYSDGDLSKIKMMVELCSKGKQE